MTHRPLSIHHLCVPDVGAAELVRLAAMRGCDHVCLFTQDPDAGIAFPVIGDDDVVAVRAAMDGHGVTALGITSFALAPDVDIAAYAAGLARGARLGASWANVRLVDSDEARAADNFAAFAALAADHGIAAGIEFSGYRAPDALPRALRVVRPSGGRIAVDALHVVRSATPIAALRALDPAEIGYLQLCDGPLAASAADYRQEGAFDRLPPGAGDFPLDALVALVSPDFPISLEVPMDRLRRAGVDPADRIARVVDAARALLARLDRAG